MFPLLQLGPLAIRLPGLFLLAGLWVGSGLIDREAKRHHLSSAVLNSLVFYGLVAGILGARLGYAFRYLDIYLGDPLSLLALNPATLSPLEGSLTGLGVILVLGQRWRLPVWQTLDAFTLSLAAFWMAVGVAHLSSGDAFGAETTAPWAIELWGAKRHPTQIYEIALAGLAFLFVWRLRRIEMFPGFLFLSWLGLASGSRLFLEAFRGDSVILGGTVRSAQLISLLVLAMALSGLHWQARRAVAAGSPKRRG